MQIILKETQLGLINSTTRIPFRYGSACLTRCPQAVLSVSIEANGSVRTGFSGDCLPPSWFDKSPDKSYSLQIDDMLAVIALAEKTFLEEFATPSDFFSSWLISYERVHSRAAEWQLTPLLASFGISMVERAVIDAMCRAGNVSFFEAARDNLFGIVTSEVHSELRDASTCDWLPTQPKRELFVRHTVGLSDPLTSSDIPADERLTDGFPQSLEEYIQKSGLRYFKIKVSNNLDRDLDRLKCIASLVEQQRRSDYRVTLDGNEQYKSAQEFQGLTDAILNSKELMTFWNNIICIEQPLERSIALDSKHTRGIKELAKKKIVIIDESDGTLDAYAKALEVGYRGVSSKNCKGPIKSLLNAGLTWRRNENGQRSDYLMTGEDLCTVGIVPVQSDLCLVATLGLDHIERNGHHYHPGLSYLPDSQSHAVLKMHGDFYHEVGRVVAPRLSDGKFRIGSLQCVGFGFEVEPDLSLMQTTDDWTFDSLGFEE